MHVVRCVYHHVSCVVCQTHIQWGNRHRTHSTHLNGMRGVWTIRFDGFRSKIHLTCFMFPSNSWHWREESGWVCVVFFSLNLFILFLRMRIHSQMPMMNQSWRIRTDARVLFPLNGYGMSCTSMGRFTFISICVIEIQSNIFPVDLFLFARVKSHEPHTWVWLIYFRFGQNAFAFLPPRARCQSKNKKK